MHLPADSALGRAVNGGESPLERIGIAGLELAELAWKTQALTADRQARLTMLAGGWEPHKLPPPLDLGPPLFSRPGTGSTEPEPEPVPTRQATPAEITALFDTALGRGA